MQVGSKGFEQANINAFKENMANNQLSNQKQMDKKEQSNNDIEKQIQKSAVEVSLSMNAQIVLYSMDANQLNKDNITAQKSIFEFLSGKETQDGLSLKDIGYEGKPITELSTDEAKELLDEGGFFSIDQTSQRVADFVFGFSGDDVELLKKGLEGIKQGFKEAQELWGGELPEISYKTQARTEELIQNKINELENKTADKTVSENIDQE